MIHLYPGRAWRRTALFSFDPFEKGRSFDKTPEYPSSLFHSGEKTGPPPGLPARTAANLPNRRKEAMMSDVSQTPTGLVIENRNWKFGRDMRPRRWMHGGAPGRTAFYHPLSSNFPLCAPSFLSAVRLFRANAAPPLRR